MIRRVTLALSVVLVMTVAVTWAHEGHEHKVMGTVTMAAADHVMLRDTANKDVTVYVDGNTKVTRDKKPMKLEDVENGMRVVITAITMKDNNIEKMVATSIELGTTQPAR